MENTRYNVVNNYKEMLQLKDMPEGAVVFNKANKKYYGHHENQWVELNCDFGKGGPQISLYDLNRQAVNQFPIMTDEQLDKLANNFTTYSQENIDGRYYMLLCRDFNYYTIFEKSTDTTESFSDAVLDVLKTGLICYSIERTEDGEAFEIWAKIKGDAEDSNYPAVFYLFPYDRGVVYYG